MDFRKKIDLAEVRDYIQSQSQETKIYIGGDSERHKVNGIWYADYTVCVVVHKDGSKGCKVFGEVVRERDYDQKKNSPTMRLMNEVYKIAALYLSVIDFVGDRECQVHLDINSDEEAVSNRVIAEATGYIRGTCNVVPMVKPNSPAASFCADRFSEIRQRTSLPITVIKQPSSSKLKRRRKTAA